MPRKTISRVPATPRLIREIKPKRRQQLRGDNNQNNNGDDDRSYQSTGSDFHSILSSSSTTGAGTRLRFHREETTPIPNDEELKDHKTNSLRERWERYKSTPLRKKMKQFLWILILYHSLKIIYMADLENGTWEVSVPSGYDSVVNVKPVSKTALLDSYGISSKSGTSGASGKTHDFLGNLVDSNESSGMSSLSKSIQSESFGSSSAKSNALHGSIQQHGKTYDFLGNLADSGGSSTNRFKVSGLGASSSGGGSQYASNNLGSSGNVQSSYNEPQSQSSYFGNSDRLVSSRSDVLMSSYDNKLKAAPSDRQATSFGNGVSNELASAGFNGQLTNSLRGSGLAASSSNALLNSSPKSWQGLASNTMDTSSNNALGSFARHSNMMGDSSVDLLSKPLGSKSIETTGDLLTMDAGLSSSSNEFSSQQSTTLNCELHGGPSQNESNEIVYWQDIPTDSSFTSPYYSPKSQEQSPDGASSFWKTKYLTFEMDGSGFNNMRLGLENVMLMAHAMGRTLVMPPRRQMAHGLVSTTCFMLVFAIQKLY